MRTLIGLTVVATAAGSATAHADAAHAAESPWHLDPWILTPLLLCGLLYGLGSLKLWMRASTGRQKTWWCALAFWSGYAALAGVLLSPLHWLAEHLFTFHMVEHEVIMTVSAPLIVLARPIAAFFWALPRWPRYCLASTFKLLRKGWKYLSNGNFATLLHGLVIWIWHIPFVFDAAVTDVVLHRLQHLSFFLVAVIFWWSVLWVSRRGVAAWHLFLTMLHTSMLGALMALAPRVLYVVQTRTAPDWGVTALEDQQLAGIIMWVPAGTIYAGGALILLALWIGESGRGGMHARSIRSS